MAAGGHHGYSAKAGAVPFPKLPLGQKLISKALGATMWFWIMYRVREDAPVLLGWRKPWEGHH